LTFRITHNFPEAACTTLHLSALQTTNPQHNNKQY